MRLLTIGRSSSCNIILNSPAVSSVHAELLILNNGDVLLIDKNSTNGTYVMNKQIKPGAEISVRRGDMIRFGDMELQWSSVPFIEDAAKYRCIYGIGSNFRNEIQVDNNTISRFHATLKIAKDNKAYIEDHSKNGTVINGEKIKSGENVRVKPNDSVVCGGIPVNLKRYISASVWEKGKSVIISSGIAAAIILGVLAYKLLPDNKIGGIFGKSPSPSDLIPATVYVHTSYNLVLTIEDDPFIEKISGVWPKEWIFGKNNEGEYVLDMRYQYPIGHSGTAFFISRDGKMGTNRHIALPWHYLEQEEEGKEKEKLLQTMAEIQESFLHVKDVSIENLEVLERYANYHRQKYTTDYLLDDLLYDHIYKRVQANPKELVNILKEVNGWISRFKKSKVNISGRHTFMGIGYPGRNYSSVSEFARCSILKESGDEKIDIALLQLNDRKTPEDIKYIYDINKARCEVGTLKPQSEELYKTGCPAGLEIGLNNEDGGLKPTIHKLTVIKEPGEYNFQYQGQDVGGSSGSPIFDRKGRLTGVLWGGVPGTQYGYGCHIKYLKELYDKTLTK